MEAAKEAIEGSIEEALKASKAATDSILDMTAEQVGLTVLQGHRTLVVLAARINRLQENDMLRSLPSDNIRMQCKEGHSGSSWCRQMTLTRQ